ncbi:unnamed protein product [Ectocarpus sp. 6 AP-2014]
MANIESVVVDPSSGDVGVSSMMICAIPDAHPRSALRAANGVLKNGGSTMTKKNIAHKTIVVADLSTCNFLLDNLPGRRWADWRLESGDTFKQALVEHVESVRTGVRDEGEDKEDEDEGDEPTETKSSVLGKSLRTIGIVGSVRVDEASGKGSVIDVIRLLCPEIDSRLRGSGVDACHG